MFEIYGLRDDLPLEQCQCHPPCWLSTHTHAHTLSLQLSQPISFWFYFSPPWFIRMCPIFMSQGTHRTSSKHTQSGSFFPKSQKEKVPPHKINNPPTHSLKQIHRRRDYWLCVVSCRSLGCCPLWWRAPSVRAASWDCPAIGHLRWGVGS